MTAMSHLIRFVEVMRQCRVWRGEASCISRYPWLSDRDWAFIDRETDRVPTARYQRDAWRALLQRAAIIMAGMVATLK